MVSIINLITNALSFLNSKKVQSIIFFILLLMGIGIFILIYGDFHHSLFTSFYFALIIILSILLTLFAIFYTKTDDRIILIAENLSIKNFKPTVIENRRVLNEYLKGIIIPFRLNESAGNLNTYSYEPRNGNRKIDLYNPNRKLNSYQKKGLIEYYPKMQLYIIVEEKLKQETLTHLLDGEKRITCNDKIKFKAEVSLIEIGEILNDLNKITKIHKSQIVKLFIKYNRKSKQYEDINLQSVKAAMSRYKKIVNQ